MRLRLPRHEATTAQVCACYPFGGTPSLGVHGVVIGRDLYGGVFCYDPFELYRLGLCTNPNMVVLGQIGRGKSALVKSYLYRQAVLGRRVFVLDPKGEYGPLGRALGVEPIVLYPGGPVRVNPLDSAGGTSGQDAASESRTMALLEALGSSSLRRPLFAREVAALDLALAEVAPAGRRARGSSPSSPSQLRVLAAQPSSGPPAPTLPEVIASLLDPSEHAGAALGTTRAALIEDGRDLALVLRRLVEGDLRGMFDGSTTPGIDPRAATVIVDLSAVYHSSALPAVMACAMSWFEAGLDGSSGVQTIFVVDEAWAVLADIGVARFLAASFKLARARGVANLAVLHRVSDLSAVGAVGSVEANLSRGLLADSETTVCFAQPRFEIEASASALALSRREAELLPRLGRGIALWRIGRRSFLVEHRMVPAEMALTDTDQQLLGGRLGVVAPSGDGVEDQPVRG